MSFQGINFANQRLLPSDDGRLYQNIFNDGALYGCGITYSGTKLTIAQGHLVIGGRQIEIESAEVLDVNQAVSGFAQIVIAIDLTKTATISTFNQISIEVRYAAAEDGFSTLTQTDINGSGSYYEAQLALLSLGTGGITGIVQNMPQAAFKGAAEGGGSSLNLHVVGGTAQPAEPKENTVWVNTNIDIHSYAFSATEPHRVSKNKNLIVYPYRSSTFANNGVNYTVSSDGSVTVSGTAPADQQSRVDLLLWSEATGIELEPGKYFLSGCPANGGRDAYSLQFVITYDNGKNLSWLNDYGTGLSLNITAPAKVSIGIRVAPGTTVSNLVFKPQLEKGSTATSFVKGDATGMVWITTGAVSPAAMNVDKKHTVMVYPISCKQYVSGSWADKTAKTYQGGQWHDWGMFLYNYGETDLDFTFTTNSFSENSGLASNHIYLVATYKSQANVTAAAEPAIDLTPYSIAKVEMSATLTDGTGSSYVGFGKTKGSYSSASYSCSSLSLQVVEIDISSLSGEYFFTAYRDAGTGETKIYSVYLQ